MLLNRVNGKTRIKLLPSVLTALILLASITPIARAEENIIRFDFETGNRQGWKIVQGKFDYFVSDRPEFHNIYPGIDRKYNKQGKYYLSTVEQQPGGPQTTA